MQYYSEHCKRTAQVSAKFYLPRDSICVRTFRISSRFMWHLLRETFSRRCSQIESPWTSAQGRPSFSSGPNKLRTVETCYAECLQPVRSTPHIIQSCYVCFNVLLQDEINIDIKNFTKAMFVTWCRATETKLQAEVTVSGCYFCYSVCLRYELWLINRAPSEPKKKTDVRTDCSR